jgi:hypothetical protein
MSILQVAWKVMGPPSPLQDFKFEMSTIVRPSSHMKKSLEQAFASVLNLIMAYGSEFRPASNRMPFLESHFRRMLENSSDPTQDILSEDIQKEALEAALLCGNHKSAPWWQQQASRCSSLQTISYPRKAEAK